MRTTNCLRWSVLALPLLGYIDKVDLVVSGINPFSNIGHDVTYSGTVTAAMEAVIAGESSRAPGRRPHHRELPSVGPLEFERDARHVGPSVDRLGQVGRSDPDIGAQEPGEDVRQRRPIVDDPRLPG